MPTSFLFLWGTFSLSAGQDGFAVSSLELFLGTQEPWDEEVEQGPKVKDIVLDWRTRQDQPMIAV